MKEDDSASVYTVNGLGEANIFKTSLRGEGTDSTLNGRGKAKLWDTLEIGVLVRARDPDRAQRIVQRSEARRQRHHSLRRR
jgi:hypothetical protein